MDSTRTDLTGRLLVLGLLVFLANAGHVMPQEPKETDTCVLQGMVFLEGEPVSARMSVRQVERLDPVVPWSWQRTRHGSCYDFDILPPDESLAVQQAGKDGRYRFKSLKPGYYEVTAALPRGLAVSRVLHVDILDSCRDQDFLLRPGKHVLRGRVRHRDGRPYRGWISLREREGHRRPVRPDPEGRFILEHLGEERVRLVAFLPGQWTACSWPIPVPRKGEVPFVVDAGVKEVGGTVVDEATGEPLAGVEVRVVSKSTALGEHLAAATTDDQGRFRVRAAMFVFALLRVRAAGYREATWHIHHPGESVCFRLRRLGSVAGRVLNGKDRKPMANVRVFALPFDKNWYHEKDAVHARTGSDGTFRLKGLPPGEAEVFAVARGWQCRGVDEETSYDFSPLAVSVRPGQTTRTEVILDPRAGPGRFAPETVKMHGTGFMERLVSGAPAQAPFSCRLVARVTDGEGKAVRGAEVSVFGGQRRPVQDGEALFNPIPAGRLWIEVRAPGFQKAGRVIQVEEKPDDHEIFVDFRLERGHVLAGRVTTAGGDPVAGAPYEVAAEGKERPVARFCSAVDGTFEVDGLPPGKFTLNMKDSPVAWTLHATASPVVTAGKEDIALIVEANHIRASLRKDIRILDPDGNPVPRYHCHSNYYYGHVSVSSGPKPGIWRVEIHGAHGIRGALLGAIDMEVKAAREQDVVVRLPRARTIQGRVQDEKGRGVRGLLVRAIPEREIGDFSVTTRAVSRARTDAAGRFYINGLGDRVYGVWIKQVPYGYNDFEPVMVRAGEREVCIVLRPEYRDPR